MSYLCLGIAFADHSSSFIVMDKSHNSSPVDRVSRRSYPLRAFWLVVGFLALGIGIIGIVVPLLPTTPLVLLAAFAFGMCFY